MILEQIKTLLGLRPGSRSPQTGTVHFQGFDIPFDLVIPADRTPGVFAAVAQAHMDNLERFVGIRPDSHIIEIGCGCGKDAIPLTQRLSSQGSYVGIDIMESTIDWCRSNITTKFPNFKFNHFNIKDNLYNSKGAVAMADMRLPAADASTDLIILQSVFTHMFAEDIACYLREFARVLKPQGRVYATLFLYSDEVLASARRTNLTPYDLRFEHQRSPGCRINRLDMPAQAVAYTEEFFADLVARSGLRLDRTLRGGWSGYFKDPPDGQDVALLARA